MIQIITDTTSSLPVETARALNIPYLPQIIIFGEESYRDDNEIDSETFLKKLKASTVLPKTAAPPPALYTPIYQELLDKGQTAVVLCPSSDVSGTLRSATVAAKDFPQAKIHLIDTRSIGSGLGSIVLQALEWAKQGMDEIPLLDKINSLTSRNRTYFVVDTLEYLQKGGRIGRAKALIGSILQVKPILRFRDGIIEAADSQRTQRKALVRLREIVSNECPHNENAHLTIMHADALEEAKMLAEDLKSIMDVKEIPIFKVPPAIIVHAGPGVLAVSFFTEG